MTPKRTVQEDITESEAMLTAFIKRVKNGIWRRIDPSNQGRVSRIMKNPPAVRNNHIVFSSSGDFSGNPKALFLYMMEHGYGEKYEFTWLFEDKENMRRFNIPGIRKALIWDDEGIRTPAAQKAFMSARYAFYSHNVNWARKYSPEQTCVNLWHGCGYKGNVRSDKRKIHYDYVMVTGKKYIDVFKEHLKDPDGRILDLGYPRNEFFSSERTCARALLEQMKTEAGAQKAVMWMPTYRKSRVERLSTDTGTGETGLPVLYSAEDIVEFDRLCREKSVLVILKQHMLASADNVIPDGLHNIRTIDEDWLRVNEAELYEMLAASDALLTDYSSVAIDYLLVDKPIGYAIDDFEKYGENRSWCLDNVKDYMAGHHIYTKDDMTRFVSDVADGLDPHREWRARIRPEIHTYTSDFSRRILDYFGL